MRGTALLAVLAVLALLSACKREPTFDERYASAQQAIRQKAGELDKDMVQRAGAANQAAPKPTATVPPTPRPSGKI